MGRISNGWRLAKSSWRVLSQDRELLSIPIVAGVISLIVFAIVAGAGVLLVGDNDSADWAQWIIIVLASVLAMWVSVIGQAAVISGAGQRMDGEDPTLGTAFAGARGRTGRLLEWAVLATAVSIILDVIRDRLGFAGQIIAGIGNIAFQVASFLALPVIVFENVGAIESFKRSSQLLRSTWGEQLTFTFGLGLIGFLAALPGIAVAVGAGASGVTAVAIVGVTVGVLWVLAVIAVTSTLSAVFKTALYRHARGLPVDLAFAPSDLSGAFRPRGAR